MDIEQRLASLDRGQMEILRRIDSVDGDLAELKDTVRDTVIEIGGVPDDIGRDPNRRSMRSRIHDLENDRSAQDIAAQAVASMKSIQNAADQKRFTRFEKSVALCFTAILAVGPYVAPYLHH